MTSASTLAGYRIHPDNNSTRTNMIQVCNPGSINALEHIAKILHA